MLLKLPCCESSPSRLRDEGQLSITFDAIRNTYSIHEWKGCHDKLAHDIQGCRPIQLQCFCYRNEGMESEVVCWHGSPPVLHSAYKGRRCHMQQTPEYQKSKVSLRVVFRLACHPGTSSVCVGPTGLFTWVHHPGFEFTWTRY